MRHAIGYALHWPERRDLPVARLDLSAIATLNFRAPDPERYPALRLAREVMQRGGLSGAVFNAAKERALDAFIAGRIGFPDMAVIVEDVLTQMSSDSSLIDAEISLDTVAHVDHLARVRADEAMKARAG
jgi:1-deoxy-D-xylulose-5-phosphate reductoisomerase